MLTYSKNTTQKRRDRPWLLFLLVMIWISGTAFFHSPWEPYEPFVLAVVKGILINNSWIVPYVANAPYLEIQPFYFWIFAAILKLFNIHNIVSIANSVRIINTMIIFGIVFLTGRTGSKLSAYKNGRTTVLILVSTIGFINNAYQLSPNILILLGFSLYLYSLERCDELPGLSACLLFIGLFFISISFTFEFIAIALFLLLLMPCVSKSWRNINYLYTTSIGFSLFAVVFLMYSYQLFQVNSDFFEAWKFRYSVLSVWQNYHFYSQLIQVISALSWYILPGWILVMWTLYKRKKAIFEDKMIVLNLSLTLLILIFALFSSRSIESNLFPLVLPIAMLGSLEIDSIRISVGALFNWFSIFIFGLIGLIIWFLYFVLIFNYPKNIAIQLSYYSQNYHYNFNIWQLLAAIIITVIWLFMITRRHIRGRELISNWASGTTFVLILFMALCLPWFDAVLSFKDIVHNSTKYLEKTQCIATNGNYSSQSALWYYYENLNLLPSFLNINFTLCNQAIVVTDDIRQIDMPNWKILWVGHRPIDKKYYYVIHHK